MSSDVAGFMGNLKKDGKQMKKLKTFDKQPNINEGNPPDPNDKKNKKTVGFK